MDRLHNLFDVGARQKRGRASGPVIGLLLGAALLSAPSPAAALQQPFLVDSLPADSLAGLEEDPRKKAGVRIGEWAVEDLETGSNATSSSIPAMDAYLQRGMTSRLATSYGLGLWRRTRTTVEARTEVWIAPLFGGMKAYPLTDPGDRVEPYATVDAGPALGLEQRRSTGFGNYASDSHLAAGVGARAGVGLEVELGEGVGVAADFRYQSVRYLTGEIGGRRSFSGVVIAAGLTYRVPGG